MAKCVNLVFTEQNSVLKFQPTNQPWGNNCKWDIEIWQFNGLLVYRNAWLTCVVCYKPRLHA